MEWHNEPLHGNLRFLTIDLPAKRGASSNPEVVRLPPIPPEHTVTIRLYDPFS